jgi:hypothetical protein
VPATLPPGRSRPGGIPVIVAGQDARKQPPWQSKRPPGGMSADWPGSGHGLSSGRRSSSRSNKCHTYAEAPRSRCECRPASAGVGIGTYGLARELC